MASEWVTAISTIGGGLVGVAGTLGATWLVQRREERAEARRRRDHVNDTRREERKQAYIRLLDALTRLDQVAKHAGFIASLGRDTKDEKVQVTDVYQELSRSLHDVAIVGADDVVPAAEAALRDAARVVDSVLVEPKDVQLVDESVKSALVAAIRRDLDARN